MSSRVTASSMANSSRCSTPRRPRSRWSPSKRVGSTRFSSKRGRRSPSVRRWRRCAPRRKQARWPLQMPARLRNRTMSLRPRRESESARRPWPAELPGSAASRSRASRAVGRMAQSSRPTSWLQERPSPRTVRPPRGHRRTRARPHPQGDPAPRRGRPIALREGDRSSRLQWNGRSDRFRTIT